MKAKVKFFLEHKGYGFLRNEKGEDTFFHITDFNSTEGVFPTLGMAVTYDVVNTNKGVKAINVTPVL